MAASTGKVRAARLTDLSALGELSRLAQADGEGTRSLGLPVAGPRIGVFSLFRLPLGAFTPHDVMYVFDRDGHVAGLLRVERESSRDEWTVVELDAVGDLDAGDVRFRLVQHLLRDGSKRGAVRFHVACADADDNVELFMQAGFVRYGDERLLFRDPGEPLPAPMSDDEAAAAGIREARSQDALALSRLYADVTPSPVQRLEALRLPDWERQGRDSRVPRSSLAPILRFADVEAFVLPAPDGGHGRHAARRVRPGRGREGGPAALPQAPRAPRSRRRPAPALRPGRHRRARGVPRRRTARGCSLPSAPTSRRWTAGSRRRASTRSPSSRS